MFWWYYVRRRWGSQHFSKLFFWTVWRRSAWLKESDRSGWTDLLYLSFTHHRRSSLSLKELLCAVTILCRKWDMFCMGDDSFAIILLSSYTSRGSRGCPRTELPSCPQSLCCYSRTPLHRRWLMPPLTPQPLWTQLLGRALLKYPSFDFIPPLTGECIPNLFKQRSHLYLWASLLAWRGIYHIYNKYLVSLQAQPFGLQIEKWITFWHALVAWAIREPRPHLMKSIRKRPPLHICKSHLPLSSTCESRVFLELCNIISHKCGWTSMTFVNSHFASFSLIFPPCQVFETTKRPASLTVRSLLELHSFPGKCICVTVLYLTEQPPLPPNCVSCPAIPKVTASMWKTLL